MRKKKDKTWKPFAVFLIIVLFAGCQKMPDEVKEQQKEYGDNPIKEEVELQYCNLEQLKQTSLSDIDYVPDNMVLPETVDFSQIEDVALLELAFVDDFTEKKNQIAEQFGIENPEWERNDGQLNGDSWFQYENTGASQYLALEDNGQISFLQNAVYSDLGEENAAKINKILRYPNIASADDVCSLNQEKISIKDLAAWIEQYLQDSPIVSQEFDYRAQTIYIRERASGEERISILAGLLYNGILLDYFGGSIDMIDDIPKVVQMDASVELEMDSVGTIDRITNQGQFVLKSRQSGEKFVNLESAIRLAEKEISGFQKLEIADIKLLYALYPEYDYKSGTEYYAAPGNIVRARPVYSFMIAYGRDDASIGVLESSTFCFINVDLFTGEVTTNMDSKGLTLQ